MNHDYGRTGLDDLRKYVDRAIRDDKKTFTICQYDDGPLVDLGDTRVFLASRKAGEGSDIPLLSSPHKKPLWPIRKKFKASFAGRIATHPIRSQMAEALRHRSDVAIVDGDHGARFFVRLALSSYAALAPRGYGGSSFRFFEAMQLGVAPILIGQFDTRPFKKYIDWAGCSFFVSEPSSLPELLDSVDESTLLDLGGKAAAVYGTQLAYGKWCELVIRELEEIG